jgi:hypothetical protein
MTTGEIIFAIIGAVLTASGIILAGIRAMLSSARKKGTDEHRLSSVEIKVDGLKCGEHIQSVNSMHVDMEALRGDIKAVRNDMRQSIELVRNDMQLAMEPMRGDIKMMMSHMGIGKNVGFTANNSPAQLTQKGKEFVAAHSLDAMMYRNWEYTKKLISDKSFTTAYDIDKFCFDQALLNPEQFFLENDFARIKDVAFSRGERLEEYSGMIAVIIRNRYFHENGISIADIDNVLQPT